MFNNSDLLDATMVIKEVLPIEKNNQIIGAKLICYKQNQESQTYKFTLWKFKRDGGETKAYMVYKAKGYGAGSTVTFVYTEEPREFINESGETITTKNRTIAWFKYNGISPELSNDLNELSQEDKNRIDATLNRQPEVNTNNNPAPEIEEVEIKDIPF